jgi:hypothetical protein
MEEQNFNPETCSIEDLKDRIDYLENEEEYYNTMQLSAKTFINSVYGVFGTAFFNLANSDIAESITLQGQDLIKFSVNEINDYINNHWNQDYEGHKRIADRLRNIFGDAFKYDEFLDLAKRNLLKINTIQVYGDTDSCNFDTLIRTKKYPDGITIEDFYNINSENKGETTIAGHESVYTTDKVLNFKGSILTNISQLYYGDVKRIIRHKVSKPKWTITTRFGHSVTVTNDHSMMVLRDDKLYKVKPCEIHPGDNVISLRVMCGDIVEGSDKVTSCLHVGEYEDEYVYDIEMDDETHTFFANDILVHNSAYITLQPLIDACNIPLEQQLEFDLAFYEEILEDYMDEKFDMYAKKNHCLKNLEKFELEKISRTIIMLAKKNYMCDVEWIDTGTRFDPLEHITYTGFDVVKGTTTDYCREEMKTFVNYVMDILNSGRKPTLGEIVSKLKEIKKRFIMQNPNDISITKGISNYENFVKNDKTPDIEYYQFKTKVDENGNEYLTNDKLPVPIHVRAAAVYNNMLFNKGKKYKSKYSLLKSGEKVRFYYTGDDTVFGFVPDSFPIEFAPAIDIDIQFEKMLLSPLNRIVSAMGYFEIPPTLTYTKSLF